MSPLTIADCQRIEREYYRGNVDAIPRELRMWIVTDVLIHAWKHLAHRRGRADNEARREINAALGRAWMENVGPVSEVALMLKQYQTSFGGD